VINLILISLIPLGAVTSLAIAMRATVEMIRWFIALNAKNAARTLTVHVSNAQYIIGRYIEHDCLAVYAEAETEIGAISIAAGNTTKDEISVVLDNKTRHVVALWYSGRVHKEYLQ